MRKIPAFILSLLLMISLLTACGSASSTPASVSGGAPSQAGGASSMKVAAIFGGAITDGNWNQTQYNGLKKIEALGATIGYMENVNDTDAAEAARTYAADGYNLIYLTTNSYQDHCTSVAKDFPEVTFVQINGTIIDGNFISVRIADEEQGFMQGVIAALLSKSGKVGFIGGMEINPIKLGSSGFQQGVDYANATYELKVEAKRINTGSFTDVNQAKETAISMIESGCDVVAPMANDASVGVMEAAEEKGVLAIGAGLGQDASAPTATRTIVVKDVSIAYDKTFEAFLQGGLKATEVETYGANHGVVYITDWLGDVEAETKDRVAETMTKLTNGEIEISLS